jgi:hypothetical protein
MINNSNFLLGEIPKFHPIIDKYNRLNYWREVKRKTFEGMWVGGRWCPPELYFHVNLSTIQFLGGGRKVQGIGQPWFRDIEWEKAFIYSEACGFSGFIDDPVYTCLRDAQTMSKDELYREFCTDNTGKKIDRNYKSLFTSSGEIKKYMDARSYFYRTDMSADFGNAIYLNQARNVLDMESRSSGKSYWSSSCIQHNLLTDGSRFYDEYLEGRKTKKFTSISQTFVGAIEAKYSADLLGKVKFSLEHLPGEIQVRLNGEDKVFHSPLMPDLGGSWESGAKNPMHDMLSGSSVIHRTFMDNPLAANGTRPTRAFIEECFAPGTKVRMADLSIKNIEDIQIGDLVLGADGKPKKVGRVVSGEDLMYKIEQKRGCDYVVNSKHLLYVEQRCNIVDIKDDGIKLIRAEDFELIGKYRMKTSYGKTSGLITLDRPKRNILRIEPYYLGVWIGDGLSDSQSIVVNKDLDTEIYDYISDYSGRLNLTLKERSNNVECNYDLKIVTPTKKHGKTNVLRTALRHYGILGNKRIPEPYLRGTEKQRLDLLAGIIDTDGNFSTNPRKTSNSFEIGVSFRTDLVNDICFLARSLGFDVHVIERESNLGYDRKIIETRTKYRISIKGEIWRIPCRVKRKKVSQWNKTNAVNSTPIKVSCIGMGTYYGITLEANKSSDRLFLLEDNTIVHNCGFMYNIQETLGALEATQSNRETNKYLPIYMLGTGGYTTTGTALWLKDIFYNPEAYDCLAFEDTWENKGKIGYFVPATKGLNDFKEGPNYISNEERALKTIEAAREKAIKSNNKIKVLTTIINQPIKPSEVFMTIEGNFFPVEDLRDCLERLESTQTTLSQTYKVEFSLVDGRVIPKTSSKPVIREFPLKKGISMDTAIEIFEMPKRLSDGSIPQGRYLASWDPIELDGNDDYAQSLQSVWILDSWTDRLVAEYTGRTYIATDFYEQTRRLLIYYNALCNYENNVKGPYAHMINKNSLHLLCDTPEILSDKSLSKPSNIGNKSKGTRVSGNKTGSGVINFGINEALAWLEAPAYDRPEGTRVMDTIQSPALLRELIGYSPQINCDRVSSLILLMIIRADRQRITEVSKSQSIKTKASDPIFRNAYRKNVLLPKL